eukprot:3573499-Pleurochrysis_carterae.AAC.1
MPALEYTVKHSAYTPSEPSHMPGRPSKPIQSHRPFGTPAYNSENLDHTSSRQDAGPEARARSGESSAENFGGADEYDRQRTGENDEMVHAPVQVQGGSIHANTKRQSRDYVARGGLRESQHHQLLPPLPLGCAK